MIPADRTITDIRKVSLRGLLEALDIPVDDISEVHINVNKVGKKDGQLTIVTKTEIKIGDA